MQITEAQRAAPRPDTPALLFQGVLTGVVRIQSGRQPLGDAEVFRQRMKAALQEVERETRATGYSATDMKDAEFAVVAFLDETILSSKDPKAEEWRRRPLTIELFGQADAGNVFFDRLSEIEKRRDSPELADLLEVYLVCLLLGFEGRFAPPLRGECHRIIERLRGRVEAIRGTNYSLSPPLDFSRDSGPAVVAARSEWRWWVLGILGGAILFFLLYWVTLSWRLGELESVTQ